MQTVGELLRSEREKKGLAIKDAERATSIRALYLSAIEEGKYSVVPGEVYLKGFIRNYANYLGLDGQQMVDLYRQQQQPVAAPPTSKDPSSAAKQQESKPEQQPTDEPGSSLKWLGVGAVVVAIAAGAFWFSQSPAPAPIQQQQQQAVPVPVPGQPVTPPAAVVPQSPATAKPVVINAKYTAECWTLVTADGKEVYEGTAKAGDNLSWEADKTIVIKVGNAGGIDIVYDGQPVGKLGDKGDVVTKTFTAKKP